MRAKLKQLASSKPVVLSLAFGLIAATIITISLAASPNASLESESSSNRTNVTVGSDSNASNGQYVQFSNTADQVQEPAPAHWQAAWDTRDQATIDAWYEANTGYEAGGYSESDLWDVGGRIDVTASWLNSNNGNGHVRQEGGRWIIEAVKASQIRISADNVTVRGALVEMGSGPGYGIQYRDNVNFSNFGVQYSGAVIEYCTVTDRDSQGSQGIALLFSSLQEARGTTEVRYCEVYNIRTGSHASRGEIMEYNYIHDVHRFDGSHNTAMSIRGSNVTLLRNNLADGTSSSLAVYANDPIHNSLIEENLFNGRSSSYCIHFGKDGAPLSTNNRLINNRFGRKFLPECGQYGPLAGGSYFSEVTGNAFLDGELVP